LGDHSEPVWTVSEKVLQAGFLRGMDADVVPDKGEPAVDLDEAFDDRFEERAPLAGEGERLRTSSGDVEELRNEDRPGRGVGVMTQKGGELGPADHRGFLGQPFHGPLAGVGGVEGDEIGDDRVGGFGNGGGLLACRFFFTTHRHMFLGRRWTIVRKARIFHFHSLAACRLNTTNQLIIIKKAEGGDHGSTLFV
jgi:hypothetical protein